MPEELARAQFSHRLAEQYFARVIERDEIVDDVILGTKINGQGHVSGNIRIVFEPSPNEIRFNLIFTGVCRSRTQGVNDVVILQNTAETHFEARKQFIWGSQGLTTFPATATAQTHSTTGQINSTLPGLRGWIATGIAQQRVPNREPKPMPSLRSIPPKGFDAVWTLIWIIRFPGSGWRRRMCPKSSFLRRSTRLEVSSTPDTLHIVLRRGPARAVARKTPSPVLPTGCDMAIQIHRDTMRSFVRDPITLLIGAGLFQRIAAADRPAVPRRTAAPVSRDQRPAWQLTSSRDGQWLMAQHGLPVPNITGDVRRAPLPVYVKPVAASSGFGPAAEIR